ncbi:MAG: DNA ligase D [Sphingomonadales bacterium]
MPPDPLDKYNAKRDFAKTAEPAGKRTKGLGNIFMVQKHDATRLHWDLRLEADGVLKSWAVTRGPSANPDDKRLAVRTEDHPLGYATFEGTIPKGEYGGGTVMLWDRGTWAPIAGKSAKDIDEGHLHFTLDGERMKGEWMLIRLKPRGKERGENWLLRKVQDAFAGGSDDLVERCVTSVATGRTMEAIAAGTPAPKSGHVAGKPPVFHAPQLATLVNAVPTGNNWLHEMKYDGYRALVATGGGKAKVFTRSGLDWSAKFPEVAEAAAALDVDSALIDGEIVALDAEGRPDFSTLQSAIKDKGGRGLTMFAFDVLSIGRESLTKLPNIARKARLRAIVPDTGVIRFADHVIGQGEKLFDVMCKAGVEGIVSKRADAAYSGKRTTNWLKVKCTRRQEFVVVGWSQSEAKSRGFKSLLLGLHEGGKLRYAGKVGTGFDADTGADIRARLDKLTTDMAPVDVPREAARGAHWVKPKLVAEVAFAEFTAENVVRHASFIGLREDKGAKEVILESPSPLREGVAWELSARTRASLSGTGPTPTPPLKERGYRISSPDRVIDADSGATKRDLAAYYEAVGAIMLPVLAQRPISLVRCPQGRAKQCFFQKHDAGSFGDAVHAVPIREKNGLTEDYLWIDSIDGILACVQMGTIEFHGWGARSDTVEQPDRLIFDLDPDVGLSFEDVKSAAFDIKQHLADIGLVSFAMLSGGKGVHVIAPLTPQAKWPEVKDFASRFAQALSAAEPNRFVATMAKAKRKGRIFIDWLRNQRGSTAVVPYSARARANVPVSAPVTWEELRKIDSPAKFTIRDAAELNERATSAELAGWGMADQVLPDA